MYDITQPFITIIPSYIEPLLTSELLGKPDDYDAKQISQSLSSSMMIKLTDLKVIEKIGQGLLE